jgi:hypothetical protein
MMTRTFTYSTRLDTIEIFLGLMPDGKWRQFRDNIEYETQYRTEMGE